MQTQNYQNHARYVPIYHFILWSIVLAIIVISVINLIMVIIDCSGLLQASLLVLIAIALVINAPLTRTFALAAQDRAIRVEENLRYYTLTGKLLDSRLTLIQIIALRSRPTMSLSPWWTVL